MSKLNVKLDYVKAVQNIKNIRYFLSKLEKELDYAASQGNDLSNYPHSLEDRGDSQESLGS
jgi:hypothetical protein